MDVKQIVAKLKKDAERMIKNAQILQTAANALEKTLDDSVEDWKESLKNAPLPNVKPRRKISAAGRKAIKKAQEARWAKYRKEHKVIQMKKRA